jgi:hypothetical protein
LTLTEDLASPLTVVETSLDTRLEAVVWVLVVGRLQVFPPLVRTVQRLIALEGRSRTKALRREQVWLDPLTHLKVKKTMDRRLSGVA